MTVSRDKISVAVVGLGVGEQHALAFRRDPRCELKLLFDIQAEKCQEVARRLEVGNIARSFEEIVEDPSIDIVSIASYDDAHFKQVVTALECGKNVFVEKPLCRTLDELREIKRIWLNAGGDLKLLSNVVLRAAPIYRWLKDAISGEKLGEIYSFDGDYLYGRLHKITEGWRTDILDYSVMEGGGVHLVDLMVWLTGKRPVSVCSSGNRICTEGTDFAYDDFVASTFKFEGGLIGRITANFGCVHRHQHVLRVFGKKATFINDDMGPRLHTSREPDGSAEILTADTLPKSKGDLIPKFVSAVLGEEDISRDMREMFDVISICASADGALRRGKETEVKYI